MTVLWVTLIWKNLVQRRLNYSKLGRSASTSIIFLHLGCHCWMFLQNRRFQHSLIVPVFLYRLFEKNILRKLVSFSYHARQAIDIPASQAIFWTLGTQILAKNNGPRCPHDINTKYLSQDHLFNLRPIKSSYFQKRICSNNTVFKLF